MKIIYSILIAAFSLLEGVHAYEYELVYGLDFNDLAIADNSLTDKATLTPGGDSFNTHIGYLNNTTGVTGESSFKFHDSTDSNQVALGGYFSLGAQSGSGGTAIAGVNAPADGFSINFTSRNTTGVSWKDAIGFTYGNRTFELQYGGSGSSMTLYSLDFSGTNARSVAVSLGAEVGQWVNYTVAVKDNSLTLIAISDAGSLLGKATLTVDVGADAQFTHLGAGGRGINDQRAHGSIHLDDLGIWNGVLDQGQAMTLAQGSFEGQPMAQIIPEPSTASLSLLALVGLMARRRRK